MILKPRDEEILRTVSLKVRLLSFAQLAEMWWSLTETGKANARERLQRLVKASLLRRLRVQARPLPKLERPVLAWKPTEPEPDFGPAAWQLQKRWTVGPRQTTVYLATAKAANQFGGRLRGVLRRDFQATHDLGVSAMYLHLLQNDPAAAKEWIGEDVLSPLRRGEKLPDAVLARAPDCRPRQVLEFGGAYDVFRLRRFHDDCESRNLPYQVW
jgi:hypothetical protein